MRRYDFHFRNAIGFDLKSGGHQEVLLKVKVGNNQGKKFLFQKRGGKKLN